ncbi:MAG: bifunctional folylpolyglutamate synthase/dihydrofolate synthase [Acidobacteria bacterium]|nr:MAG: bifunctional folylpolyglutamate synthase/dihydrofolate synthase [Acidobacteriota bacterium]
MNYHDCLEELARLGQELRGVKFDLATIQTILASLGDPHLRYPTAIVAGTNGKGSTSAFLASILQAAGYRTGLYTSPHLLRPNERIRLNGREISDADFADVFTRVWEVAGRLLENRSLAQRPSFFEFLTASGFVYFARQAANFAVLEVGMGGRLDATNVTIPRVAVITNIDLDHEKFLGETHAAIAAEKAGVIKPGRPVVSSVENPEAREVIRRRARELGAPLVETESFARVAHFTDSEGLMIFDLTVGEDPFSDLAPSLRGRFQLQNAITAVTAAWLLKREGLVIPQEAVARGLERTSWPGRLEFISESPLVVLDGAHNPGGARELAAFATEHWAGRRLRLVYASMRDKAIGEISRLLFPLAEVIYLTLPDQPRAASPEEILSAVGRRPANVRLEDDPVRALERALAESAPDDVVLAAGSLFLVGAIKKAQQEGRLKLGRRMAIPVR